MSSDKRQGLSCCHDTLPFHRCTTVELSAAAGARVSRLLEHVEPTSSELWLCPSLLPERIAQTDRAIEHELARLRLDAVGAEVTLALELVASVGCRIRQ